MSGGKRAHPEFCRQMGIEAAPSTRAQCHQQASKGKKKTERHVEPSVPPSEGSRPHPLEETEPPEVTHDPAEEDGHESPRPCDKHPTRQRGAPQPESAQHDETR